MELHPVWEKDSPLKPDLWYVVSAVGQSPTMRVGHSVTYIPTEVGPEGKLYVIAGANPDGQLSDIYVLDLETFSWDTIDTTFTARYEHVCFIPESQPSKIYILLGAEKTGNLNDVQTFDIASKEWCTIQVHGTAPSPRTHHSTAQVGDKVYVYCGGEQGSDPVQDRNVYEFDASTSTWTVIETQEPPKPRLGHVLLAHDNKIILHGGMCGQSFLDDLHILDLETKKWRNVKQRKIFPSARAAHSGCVIGGGAYIMGGLGRDGALDDLFRLDLASFKWQKINIQGAAPTPRLDFAMTVIQARVPCPDGPHASTQAQEALLKLEKLRVDDDGDIGRKSTTNELTVSDSPTGGILAPSPTPNTERYKTVSLLAVHGGMDTQGEIWDDMLVFMLDQD